MLKKNICIALITLVAYLIQSTFLHYFEIGTVIPNLIVVLVVCAALSELPLIHSTVYGAVCGMLLDFSAETIFGINALLCMYSAIICNIVAQKLFKGKFTVNIMFIFIMSFVYEAVYYFLSFSMRQSTNVMTDLLFVALPCAAYNAVLAMGIIFIMQKIAKIE